MRRCGGCRRGSIVERKEKKKKKGESGEAAIVFFASFLDTKKEVGCGAKPHCYRKITENQPINLVRNHQQRSKRSKASGVMSLFQGWRVEQILAL